MNILIFDTPEQAINEAFKIVRNQIVNNPLTCLGLATGSTPIKLYKKMVRDFHITPTNYKSVKALNLDEYIGLDYYSIHSYAYYMEYNLYSKININKNNIFIPNGKATDLDKECKRYDKLLENNPVDLQILGIGQNGHIGFNEPGTSFDLNTHIVDLKESTIAANKKYFGKMVKQPTKAFTMGINSIMKSNQILLLAFGESKSDAIVKMIEEDVNVDLPASILQRHNNTTVILDKKAASKLEKR